MTCEFPLLQATDSLTIEQAGKMIIEDERHIAAIVAKILEKDRDMRSSHNTDMEQYDII